MSLLNLLEEFVMFEKIRKMKNKKGFTLVELIVVLVILAILAALLIPALTGYIDKANEEKVTAECRMVVMGAQTVGTTFYADHSTLTDKNNPFKQGNQSDLFEFPSRNGQPTSFVMGDTPYMELNVGIHNIFKILRVDYVRRLNYLNAPNAKKNGVRFVLQFDF